VFAGAAREAVFSKTEVVRRVQSDFVAVALKAALVNNPPGGDEGKLYREIARSKIAPQGICVLNSAGKVLDWVMMFDDEKSVLAFLDHARKRFAKYPDAKRPVPAERFMKYPGNQLEDVEDTGKALLIPARHAKGTSCPGTPPMQRGTVGVRVFGRALGKDGKPVADTVRQEHYVEDRFPISVSQQRELATALTEAGARRFRIADDLARLLVSHAYLGQLDVNPVSAPGGMGKLDQCEFWGQKVETEKGPTRLRIDGKSQATGASGGEGGDGRLWDHEVKLTWEGLIEMKAERITRLLLLANGSEKLHWGNKDGAFANPIDVARLPAGHAIDLACKVRYGFLGEPLPDAETTDAPMNRHAEAGAEMPEEARRQLLQSFGPATLVFRAKVQKELGLSDAQKKKVTARRDELLQDAMRFIGKMDGLGPRERERKFAPYRQKVEEKLAEFHRANLDGKQLGRLRQIELQQHGFFALGRPDVQEELKITDDQRERYMKVVQAMERKVRALIEEAESGGRPEIIFPKILKVRKDHESKLGEMLSAEQKKRWKEMVGKPFDPGD
jgi:hypothetical protein